MRQYDYDDPEDDFDQPSEPSSPSGGDPVVGEIHRLFREDPEISEFLGRNMGRLARSWPPWACQHRPACPALQGTVGCPVHSRPALIAERGLGVIATAAHAKTRRRCRVRR
jgi:hypothetical protein